MVERQICEIQILNILKILEFLNYRRDMHMFTASRFISKSGITKQNGKVGIMMKRWGKQVTKGKLEPLEDLV